MAQIVLKTEGLKGTCIICNCFPKDETKEGHVYLPMFHAVGVDVNWGEDLNICQICVGVMADMLGRRSIEEYMKVCEQLSALQTEHGALREEHAEQTDRITKILAGRRAAKAQKEKRAA